METTTTQPYDEWREQKSTYAVPREGVITTSRGSFPPISYGKVRVRVHLDITPESAIVSEFPEPPQSGLVGQQGKKLQ